MQSLFFFYLTNNKRMWSRLLTWNQFVVWWNRTKLRRGFASFLMPKHFCTAKSLNARRNSFVMQIKLLSKSYKIACKIEPAFCWSKIIWKLWRSLMMAWQHGCAICDYVQTIDTELIVLLIRMLMTTTQIHWR